MHRIGTRIVDFDVLDVRHDVALVQHHSGLLVESPHRAVEHTHRRIHAQRTGEVLLRANRLQIDLRVSVETWQLIYALPKPATSCLLFATNN